MLSVQRHLGAELADAMKSEGLTIQQMARQLNTTPTQIRVVLQLFELATRYDADYGGWGRGDAVSVSACFQN